MTIRTHAVLAGFFATLLSTTAQAEITIGVSTSLTGSGASLGIPVRDSLSLWPQSIGGEKLRFIVLDDSGDPSLATRNARRLVSEEKVDLILGAANTPAAIAIAKVAQETQTIQLAPAPASLPPDQDQWVFRSAMHGGFWVNGMLEHAKASGAKSVAFLGVSDAFGEQFLKALKKQAPAAGLEITAEERFSRADASVTAQALKIVASRPDAVIVVAVGGGSAVPQKALKARGYKGMIIHSPASVTPDFVRLAGKDAEGTLAISSPESVADQLPGNNPSKKIALDFLKRYEAEYGRGSGTKFAGNSYDFALVLQEAVPVALKQAEPGTLEFRKALREALETVPGVAVTKGVLDYTADDHWGFKSDARVMLVLRNGNWELAGQ